MTHPHYPPPRPRSVVGTTLKVLLTIAAVIVVLVLFGLLVLGVVLVGVGGATS